MANEKEQSSNTANREITSTRIINAPRELVFKVWTDPQHIAQWWGPNGFSITIHKMEVKPEGVWDFIMHGPDGTDFKNVNIFKEIVQPEKLVYEHANYPKHHTTVTFEEQGNKTKLTMRMIFESATELKEVVEKFKAVDGQQQTLNRLEGHLAEMIGDGNTSTEPEFTISRTFNAPRELVYKVFSEAEHLAQWWGPKGFKMMVTKLDFKPGGVFHYSMQSPEGMEMWGRFVYQEMVKPERIVFVNSFSDKDGNITRAPFSPNWPLEVRNVLTLIEKDGKTTLTLHGGPINANKEERKAFNDMFPSMEQGFGGTFDQLRDYLTEISK